MVRSAAYRASKYASKSVGDVVKNRFDAQKDSMTAQFTASAGQAEGLENLTKNVLTAAAVQPYMNPPYLAFSRECGRILRTHSGAVALSEICIAQAKWVARALSSTITADIAFQVHGIDITSCSTP